VSTQQKTRQVSRGYFNEQTGSFVHEGGVPFVCSAVVNARDYDAVLANRDSTVERLRIVAAQRDQLVAALMRGLEEGALNCKFYPQADDDAVCCCGKARAYHWKADARALLASIPLTSRT
jgi:hypothetical protein